MSTIGTEICGSSSRGVTSIPSVPTRKNAISRRGVSGDSMNVAATRPAMPQRLWLGASATGGAGGSVCVVSVMTRAPLS